jgi:hypothetical protein
MGLVLVIQLMEQGLVTEMSDPTNPDHYRVGGKRYEVMRVLEAWQLTSDFYLCQVIKYCARAGHKSDDVVWDLKKARWYLDRRISLLEGKRIR